MEEQTSRQDGRRILPAQRLLQRGDHAGREIQHKGAHEHR